MLVGSTCTSFRWCVESQEMLQDAISLDTGQKRNIETEQTGGPSSTNYPATRELLTGSAPLEPISRNSIPWTLPEHRSKHQNHGRTLVEQSHPVHKGIPPNTHEPSRGRGFVPFVFYPSPYVSISCNMATGYLLREDTPTVNLHYLEKMGYHRTLPWEMVFALRSVGGIGLCHLQHEMEVQQILILLRHMRARTPLGTTMKILMRQYQLWAGIQQPILTDTQPCPWVPDKWISRLWWTLHKNNIKISYDEWMMLPLQKNNIYIMEAIVDLGLLLSQLKQINACHMFLQVTTLAEMTDHMGTHILPQVLNKRGDTNPLRLDGISQSTLTWPWVCNPTTQTWNFWMQMICSLFTGSVMNTRLRHPLGEWTT